jgi:hypothetical protein
MEKADISRVRHRIATAMRAQALETNQPEYQTLMIRAADSLEAEAAFIAEARYQEFSDALEVYSNKLFSRSDRHSSL